VILEWYLGGLQKQMMLAGLNEADYLEVDVQAMIGQNSLRIFASTSQRLSPLACSF
jgi:hypothetical protein